MKRLVCLLLVLMLPLSACGGGAAQPEALEIGKEIALPALPSPSEAAVGEVNAPPGELFLRPEPVDHPLADEVFALVDGFSMMFLFPEFEHPAGLNFLDNSVGATLYLHANSQGISPVRYDDLIAVGRRFFGDDFTFPKGVAGGLVFLDDDDPDVYNLDGFGMMHDINYFLLDVTEEGGRITADFLPFILGVEWDDGLVGEDGTVEVTYFMHRMLFIDPRDGLFEFSGDLAAFAYPDEGARNVAFENGTFWDYLYLTAPFESLGTITVTFQRADDGRLIATSSRHNRT